jgi:uncharacterized protein (DUF433 family)
MHLPSFLTQDADGEIRLSGRRIGLYTVVRAYQEHRQAEVIADEYELPLALLYKVLAFYLENQAEVEAYVTAYQADLERIEAEPPAPGVRKVRGLSDGRRPPEVP